MHRETREQDVNCRLLCSTSSQRRQYSWRTSPALCIALAPAPLEVSSASLAAGILSDESSSHYATSALGREAQNLSFGLFVIQFELILYEAYYFAFRI